MKTKTTVVKTTTDVAVTAAKVVPPVVETKAATVEKAEAITKAEANHQIAAAKLPIVGLRQWMRIDKEKLQVWEAVQPMSKVLPMSGIQKKHAKPEEKAEKHLIKTTIHHHRTEVIKIVVHKVAGARTEEMMINKVGVPNFNS